MLLINKFYQNRLVCGILRVFFRDKHFEIILDRLKNKENHELNPKLMDKVHDIYFSSLSDEGLSLEISKFNYENGSKVWIVTNEIPFWYRYFIKKSARKLKLELFLLHKEHKNS